MQYLRALEREIEPDARKSFDAVSTFLRVRDRARREKVVWCSIYVPSSSRSSQTRESRLMQYLRALEREIEPDAKNQTNFGVWCSVFVPLSSSPSQMPLKSRLVFFCCLLVQGSTRKDNAQFWWFKSLAVRLLYCNRQWSVLIYSFAMQIVFPIKLLLEPVSKTETTSNNLLVIGLLLWETVTPIFRWGVRSACSLSWLGLMTPRSGDEFV
jgi:hypothetical protein